MFFAHDVFCFKHREDRSAANGVQYAGIARVSDSGRRKMAEAGCLLESVGDADHGHLVERFADDLDSDWLTLSAFLCKSAGDAHGGEAGEIGGNGEHVFEVGLQRVVFEVAHLVRG